MDTEKIIIKDAEVTCKDAMILIGELNDKLAEITGASGSKSFSIEDMKEPDSAFVLAYLEGNAIGCGAFRKASSDTAEIKRVYARPNSQGIGSIVIAELEKRARDIGYTRLILETRRVNTNAVHFYTKLGYQEIENYGKYVSHPEAICFQKMI